MCLIVVGWKAHPRYPLIVAANRDEFFARPAAPAQWWPEQPQLLAGRDLEAGGTWLGVTRGGRFAALTNYRDPSRRRPGAPTRGLLVRDCLSSTEPAMRTLAGLATVSAGYAGFNLLLSDGQTFGIHESVSGAVRQLGPGIYGLSNHLLDTPWPKVARARERFAAALEGLPDESAFLSLLTDRRPATDEHLPQTGVGLEWERWLSSAFIAAPGYGTRCSTLLTIDADGEAHFREWSWNEEGALGGIADHRFTTAPG